MTNAQRDRAAQTSLLWIQGGVPGDPVLNGVPDFAGKYAFGALRCSYDALNGDNVEWIAYKTGTTLAYCFAYYVTPPPDSATVIVRKEVSRPAKATQKFQFEGNISYTPDRRFELAVANGSTPSATFYRAETRPGDAPWTVKELVPTGWLAPQITCTTQRGSTIEVQRATASLSITKLLAGDVVDCRFVNALVPQRGTLVLSKRALGRAGQFPLTVRPEGGGDPLQAIATTTQPDQLIDAVPSPIELDAGRYVVSDRCPRRPAAGGR